MRVHSSSWVVAMELRGFFVSEYLKYHGPTDAAAGESLIKLANRFGYSDRTRPVPGSTLRSWMDGESVPQWAVKSMVKYILACGYTPDTDRELEAMLVYVLIDVPDELVEDALNGDLLKNIHPGELNAALKKIWHAKFSV